MLNTDLHIIQKNIFGDTMTEAEQKRFDLQLETDTEFQKSYFLPGNPDHLYSTNDLCSRLSFLLS